MYYTYVRRRLSKACALCFFAQILEKLIFVSQCLMMYKNVFGVSKILHKSFKTDLKTLYVFVCQLSLSDFHFTNI